MARASNPGAPQRVSAHVVPKATPFSADDEEEKTTIESGGWEEEASTTVEQGEVAEKVRALALGLPARRSGSNTNITSTDGGGVNDEPTVDDQRAIAALALLPPPSVARLIVTGGNDSGRALEVRPGKTYTIGRGIDNDLVLTDITASRKHFDIRNENGSWILADRGSGNGTAINNRIEDAPFMLAGGDTIEVGNTAFRFDLVGSAISLPGLPRELPGARRDAAAARDAAASPLPRLNPDDADSVDLATPAVGPPGLISRELPTPAVPREPAAGSTPRDPQDPHDLGNGIPRELPGVQTFDGSVDDDLEMSTVSGKPLPLPGNEPHRPSMTASRPKTLPPPAPLPRPRTQTGRPPPGFAGPRSQSMAAVQVPQQQPIPPSALAALAPTMSPMHAPALLPQPSTTLPLPQMANRPPLSPALLDPSLGPQPTTLPGQGPPLPARGPRLPFSYPSASEIASHHSVSPHAPGNPRGPVHVSAGHPGRDATSTAQVPPMSYSGGQAAIVPQHAHAHAHTHALPPLSRRMKIALALAGLAVFSAIATIAIIRGTSSADAVDTGAVSPPPPAEPVRDPIAAPAVAPKIAKPPTVTPIQPPTQGNGSATTPQLAPPAAPAAPPAPDNLAPAAPTSPGAATASPPPRTDQGAAPANPPAPMPPVPPTPAARTDQGTAPASPATPSLKPAPLAPALEPAPTTKVAAEEPPPAPRNDKIAPTPPAPGPRGDNRKPPRRIDTRKPDRSRPVEVAPPAPRNDKKRSGKALQDVKAEAMVLYKARNFSGAAAALTSALSGFGTDDAKELKSLAALYSQLGKSYAVGMAPGTRYPEAYQALRRAIDYDHDLGATYVPALQDRLVNTATRAASSYMAAHEYELAFQAVRTSESLGSSSSNNKTVRTMLEDIASDLYRTAASELSSDPEGAKKKARQILGIVDTRNPLFAKAQKLINAP